MNQNKFMSLLFRCILEYSINKWIGFFTPLDVLIGGLMTFDIHDDSRLSFTHGKKKSYFLVVYKKRQGWLQTMD